MKHKKNLMILIAATIFFVSCQKETTPIDQTEEFATARRADVGNVVGHVYTLSNQTTGNQVIDYTRTSSGKLEWSASYFTGGTGTGGGLGNQEALVMTSDGNFLLAVNAGSHSIASLKIEGNTLSLVSTVGSGGMMPVSIAQHGTLVFALNAGGSGSISGFTIDANGNLAAIPGSTRPLSSAMAGAAQISFVQDGKVLVITEKGTNRIIIYTVDASGLPGMMHSITSSNPTPFGFAVGHNNYIYVTEAVGGSPGASTLSSYYVAADGSISLVTGPVSAGQSAACWAVITNNGKYVYATNTGSNNISSFSANASGGLEVLVAVAATTPAGPIDAALSNNSKFLYVLNAGGHSISAFSVSNDGSLSSIQTVPGVPAGATGLVSK
jgi:6-phosphogluconolactonase